MADGVHGYVAHAVRHVVVECTYLLDSVTILHHHVEEITAVVIVTPRRIAKTLAVLVRP